ncbi:UNVERIFIED_CONTAM: hypothetical protein FKN15_025372 [Acipenser sinensis]
MTKPQIIASQSPPLPLNQHLKATPPPPEDPSKAHTVAPGQVSTETFLQSEAAAPVIHPGFSVSAAGILQAPALPSSITSQVILLSPDIQQAPAVTSRTTTGTLGVGGAVFHIGRTAYGRQAQTTEAAGEWPWSGTRRISRDRIVPP